MLISAGKYVSAEVYLHILNNVEVGRTCSRIGSRGVISAKKKSASATVNLILIYLILNEIIPIGEGVNRLAILEYHEGIILGVQPINVIDITVRSSNVYE